MIYSCVVFPLRTGDMPLGDIPYLCGYDSVNFFQRMFKRESGMTMRAWRQKNLCRSSP